jgi:hypothetical protein
MTQPPISVRAVTKRGHSVQCTWPHPARCVAVLGWPGSPWLGRGRPLATAGSYATLADDHGQMRATISHCPSRLGDRPAPLSYRIAVPQLRLASLLPLFRVVTQLLPRSPRIASGPCTHCCVAATLLLPCTAPSPCLNGATRARSPTTLAHSACVCVAPVALATSHQTRVTSSSNFSPFPPCHHDQLHHDIKSPREVTSGCFFVSLEPSSSHLANCPHSALISARLSSNFGDLPTTVPLRPSPPIVMGSPHLTAWSQIGHTTSLVLFPSPPRAPHS